MYCLTKSSNDFIQDGSELWTEIVPKYDNILILSDFNIHVCCPLKPKTI